jgi:hypothetical protein
VDGWMDGGNVIYSEADAAINLKAGYTHIHAVLTIHSSNVQLSFFSCRRDCACFFFVSKGERE